MSFDVIGSFIMVLVGLLGLFISIEGLRVCRRASKINWTPQTCSKNAPIEVKEECARERRRWINQVFGLY